MGIINESGIGGRFDGTTKLTYLNPAANHLVALDTDLLPKLTNLEWSRLDQNETTTMFSGIITGQDSDGFS